MCPILTGQIFCVLFSQGTTFVSYSHRAIFLCPILTGMNKCVLFFFARISPVFRRHMCPIVAAFHHLCSSSQMCPIFQIGHICIKRSSNTNRTQMDVTCASSEYAYEICTHVVNMLDPATSRPQSLRAILLSLAPPHPTPPPPPHNPFRAASLYLRRRRHASSCGLPWWKHALKHRVAALRP